MFSDFLDVHVSERRRILPRRSRTYLALARELRFQVLERRHCLSAVVFVEHAGIEEPHSNTIALGDVDGDSNLDVLWSSLDPTLDALAWHENVDGQGSYGPPMTISGPRENQVVAVSVGDLTGDGFADVVTGEAGGMLLVYRGRGEGAFEAAESVDVDVAFDPHSWFAD